MNASLLKSRRVCSVAVVWVLVLASCSETPVSHDAPQHGEVWTPDGALADTTSPPGDTSPSDTTAPPQDTSPVADTASKSDTTPVDTGLQDSQEDSQEVGQNDVTEPDSVPEVSPVEDVVQDTAPPESVLTAKFSQPSNGDVHQEGSLVKLIVLASDSVGAEEELLVSFASDLEGALGTVSADFAGWASQDVILTKPGWHIVTATVSNAEGKEVQTQISVGVCTYGEVNTFNAGTVGPDWKIYGDATFDPGGWLEMTGNAPSKHGAIYNVGSKINPGDIEINFKIWTGGGINSGADGFAMNIVNAVDVAELESIIAAGKNGGCLGYGVSGLCGDMKIDSFHVEFDTWDNDDKDPTSQNHVAITLDGDPGNHVLWTPQVLEDSTWHSVKIIIFGQNIKVFFDGNMVIDEVVDKFQFHGGYIWFSGTTGWATNYHRFDDLWVKQTCDVP
jgi:hypothetical protein